MKAMRFVFALALALQLAQSTFAAECAAKAGCGADPAACNGGCDNCGGCGKTCKLVSTTKKIVVNCYGVKEEQFCVPGRSCEGCTTCENLCAKPGCACNCAEGCRPDCHVRYTEYCPGDADMHCRKKLVKYEATKEIPWFKWVVVDCDCNGCEVAPPAASPMPSAPPMPPKAAAMKRPAPAGAKVGMEIEVSDAEMKQLQAQIASPEKQPTAQAKSTGINKLLEVIR